MYKFISKSTKELSAIDIQEICNLKNTQWKFGIKSQINWFKKNIKSNDLHNCLYKQSHLVGYTSLSRRKLEISNKKKWYLLFDTLIIKKNLRKKKLSSSLMIFNNNIIKENKKVSFLICKNKLVNYYKKFLWKKISNTKLRMMHYALNKNVMFFNYSKNLNNLKKPIKIFINK